MNEQQIREQAKNSMLEYVDMGCFKDPMAMIAPLTEGYFLGYSEARKEMKEDLLDLLTKIQKIEDFNKKEYDLKKKIKEWL